MLPSRIANALAQAAGPVISRVLGNGGALTPKPTGEVSAVRTLTLDGFNDIAAAWSPILKRIGHRIDLHAVFCHSRPHVTFAPIPHPNYPSGTGNRTCELADLLIVIDHVDPKTKKQQRSAALVQAKMLKGGALKPSGREWIQHELLAWLPTFTFDDNAYSRRARNLRHPQSVGTPKLTAEYGGIDLNSQAPNWVQELTLTTAPWFGSRIDLNDYLACMATGSNDCGRYAIKTGADDWSFTVDELLRVTAARPITKKLHIARGNSNIVCFMADPTPQEPSDSLSIGPTRKDGTISGGGGNAGEGSGDDAADWTEGPISTVHLRLSGLDDHHQE